MKNLNQELEYEAIEWTGILLSDKTANYNEPAQLLKVVKRMMTEGSLITKRKARNYIDNM